MRVLITGANGFVGAWLTRATIELGHSALCGVRPTSDPARIIPLERRWPQHVERLMLDVRDRDSVNRAMESGQPDVVIHAAAYGVNSRQKDPIAAADTNIMGTLWVWEAAHKAGVARLVHIGTSYEYGEHECPITEDSPRYPLGIYGNTKAAASYLLRECGARGDPDPLIFWLFGVFGPGEGAHKLVPQVVRAAKAGQPLDLTEGTQKRDYLFVGDAAAAIAATATLPEDRFPAGRGFNLCSGEGVSVRDFATRIALHFGTASVLRFGARTSRPEGTGAVVGDPSRWREFCQSERRAGLRTRTSVEQALDGWDKDDIWRSVSLSDPADSTVRAAIPDSD
jgi:nucleoside-diphosphate-sugar epimerase